MMFVHSKIFSQNNKSKKIKENLLCIVLLLRCCRIFSTFMSHFKSDFEKSIKMIKMK